MENRARSVEFEVINGPIPLAVAVSMFDLDLTGRDPSVRFGLLSVDRSKLSELFQVTEEVVTANWQNIHFAIKGMEHIDRGRSEWWIWGMIWLDDTRCKGADFEGVYKDRRTGQFTSYLRQSEDTAT